MVVYLTTTTKSRNSQPTPTKSRKTMSSITTELREGKIKGYRASLGWDAFGKEKRKLFQTYEEAQAWISAESDRKIDEKFLFSQKHTILACMQRLQEVGADLQTATDFFMRHGARKINPTINNAVDELLEQKKKLGLNEAYLHMMNLRLMDFTGTFGHNTLLADVTSDQIFKYVYEDNKHLNGVSQKNIIRILSVLFNFAIAKNMIGMNPLKHVEQKKVYWEVPSLLSPEDFEKLMHRCYHKNWKDRAAIFTLVGFCGVRREEACKMTWDNINFETNVVVVPAKIAKKAAYRPNKIPANALVWLKWAHDGRKTNIIGENGKNLLRGAMRFAHIDYKKNALRHSFCSYALAADWKEETVARYMGHVGGAKTMYAHYRELVSEEAAKKWWSILPPTEPQKV